MARRLEADNPNNILEGKRKRTYSSRMKELMASELAESDSAPKIREPAGNKGSRDSRNSLTRLRTSTTSSTASIPTSEQSSRESKCARIVAVQEPEEQEEQSLEKDIESISSDSDEDTASIRTIDAAEFKPSKSGTVLQEETDEQELGKLIRWLLCTNKGILTIIYPERMMKGWRVAAYAFYGPTPEIEYRDGGRRCHVFTCLRKGCNKKIVRYLDTSDIHSTGNMRKHVAKCWGVEVLKTADEAKDVGEVRGKIIKGYQKDGSITAAFERKGKGKVPYSHRQHTKTELRYFSLF
jgi:hypothetical protein